MIHPVLRRNRRPRRVVTVLLAAGLLGACATTTIDQARTDLAAHLDQCSARSGYHPAQDLTPGTGLAPGEREFLDCAYQGVEALLVPRTAIPQAYRDLLAEHRAMTAAVAAGEMTRDQRRQRTNILAEGIRKQEAEAQREQLQRLAELQERMTQEQMMMELQEQLQRMHHLPVIERALMGR